MPFLVVEEVDYGTYHREEVEGSDYAEWRDDKDINYLGLHRTDNKHAEAVDFEPVLGSEYFLVYVDYDTGDSFGRSYGNHSIVGIFETAKEAYEIRQMIEDDMKTGADKFGSLPYKGRDCIYTGTWKGYFENFNSCEVVPLRVTQ